MSPVFSPSDEVLDAAADQVDVAVAVRRRPTATGPVRHGIWTTVVAAERRVAVVQADRDVEVVVLVLGVAVPLVAEHLVEVAVTRRRRRASCCALQVGIVRAVGVANVPSPLFSAMHDALEAVLVDQPREVLVAVAVEVTGGRPHGSAGWQVVLPADEAESVSAPVPLFM